jgi:hypothetical protein
MGKIGTILRKKPIEEVVNPNSKSLVFQVVERGHDWKEIRFIAIRG